MDILEKIKILAISAKYDASCASSGSTKKNIKNDSGNSSQMGICHSWSDDGRCISLLKILLTNNCMYDCAYCINKKSNDVARAIFTPEEVADITINFYNRNYIEGLFLSSAVFRSPDYTMELIYKTVKKLRIDYHFNGYIHVKAMPGSNQVLIKNIGLLVDRMSVNIELPSQKSLQLLAPQKSKKSILSSMNQIHTNIVEYKADNKKIKKTSPFVPAGQSTQLIIGASPESDFTILRLAEALYNHFSLKRVYYSAYIPVINIDNRLPAINPPLKRENRLYQADWLLRFYKFSAHEILDENNQNFDIDLDPKSSWALNNLNYFPVEINHAPYEMIIRIPGIGIKSAQKIVKIRKFSKIDFDTLKKIGVALKRARFFITCNGKSLENKDFDKVSLKNKLLHKKNINSSDQLHLFNDIPDTESALTVYTGEL